MNSDHMVGGLGGVTMTAMLATVLQHFQGIDTATASAEAGLIVIACGAVAGLLQRLLPPKAEPNHGENQHAQ